LILQATRNENNVSCGLQSAKYGTTAVIALTSRKTFEKNCSFERTFCHKHAQIFLQYLKKSKARFAMSLRCTTPSKVTLFTAL